MSNEFFKGYMIGIAVTVFAFFAGWYIPKIYRDFVVKHDMDKMEKSINVEWNDDIAYTSTSKPAGDGGSSSGGTGYTHNGADQNNIIFSTNEVTFADTSDIVIKLSDGTISPKKPRWKIRCKEGTHLVGEIKNEKINTKDCGMVACPWIEYYRDADFTCVKD